jgi:hypothetical protein
LKVVKLLPYRVTPSINQKNLVLVPNLHTNLLQSREFELKSKQSKLHSLNIFDKNRSQEIEEEKARKEKAEKDKKEKAEKEANKEKEKE